jgi:hypothetical protein
MSENIFLVKKDDKPYLTLEVKDQQLLMWFTKFPQRRIHLDVEVLPNLVDTLIEIQNGHNI